MRRFTLRTRLPRFLFDSFHNAAHCTVLLLPLAQTRISFAFRCGQTTWARSGKSRNSDRSIVRYEWLEAVVRLAMGRFHFQRGAVPRSPPRLWVSKAVEKLLAEHLVPHSGCVDRVTARDKLKEQRAPALVRALLSPLNRVFQYYRHTKTGYVSLPTLLRVMQNSGLIDKFLTHSDVKVIFLQNAPLMVDEMRTDRHRSADFEEFCEFIAVLGLLRLNRKREDQKSAAATDTGALFGSAAKNLTYKMTLVLLVKQIVKFMEKEQSRFCLRS